MEGMISLTIIIAGTRTRTMHRTKPTIPYLSCAHASWPLTATVAPRKGLNQGTLTLSTDAAAAAAASERARFTEPTLITVGALSPRNAEEEEF